MVPGVHDEPVGHEQEVELATLGMLGDLLDDRQVVVAGRRAVVAPSGRVIAGAEHEHAEVHLTPLRRHGPAPLLARRFPSSLGDNVPLRRAGGRSRGNGVSQLSRRVSSDTVLTVSNSCTTLRLASTFSGPSPDSGTSLRYFASTSAHSIPRGADPRGEST